MTTEASSHKNLPSPAEADLGIESQVASIWQFAQYRLNTLRKNPAVRLEAALTLGLLFLLFAPALPAWWQRWTLAGSPQLYIVLLLPLTLAWIWFHRRRLVLPELDALRRSLQEVKTSLKPLGDASEQENTLLHALLEERQLPLKRPFWPLATACLFTAFAYWLREPLFTCLAFLGVLGGLLAYRFGTALLRLCLFPLAFLFALLPLPGMLLDWFNERLQNLLFGSVLHVLLNASIEAELPIEGNPLRINPKSQQAYDLFAGQAGVGLPEVCLVLLLTVWFLSLVRAPMRLKLGALVAGGVWLGLLAVLRLLLLCWVGTMDREITSLLEPLTRLLLVGVGIGGQFLILRGFKCQKFQKWVSV